MKAQDWVLALSLVGNLVLGVLLLFKTALNNIVAGWFKDRTVRAQRSRELMIELHARLEPFDANYFLLLAANSLRDRGPTEEIRQQNQKTMDTLSPKHLETLDFMARHELEFPRKVRERVRELRKSLPFEDIKKIHDLSAIVERSEIVTKAVAVVKAELDRIVK